MERIQTYDDYLIDFVTQLHEMRTQARENLFLATEKSIIYYDKKINPVEVKISSQIKIIFLWNSLLVIDLCKDLWAVQ